MKLGRSERSPKPKINVRDFIDIEKAKSSWPVAEEASVDYSTLVSSWPMFLNDQLGDCTCAGAAHAVQLFHAMAGEQFTVADSDVERMYEQSGYVPGKPETDQGWTLAAAADYLRTVGLQGKPDIEAEAEVSVDDEDAEQVALELFGCLYEGMECPESALQQAQEGKPWSVVKGSPIDGGHCVIRPKATLRKGALHITWGTAIPATEEFDKEYFDEYMVFVPKDWESKLPEQILQLGIVDFSKLAALVDGFQA
jgi:hypothetical protein